MILFHPSHLRSLLVALLVALLAPPSNASADKTKGGPKGGRLLEDAGLRAELFVEKDHRVNLTFYDEKLEKIPAGTAVASLVAEAPSGKKTIAFEEKDGELVSKEPLPEGHGYTVVVQLRKEKGAKAKNFRLPFDTSTCDECGRAEYACICEDH